MYKKILDAEGNVSENAIFRTEDSAFIPADPANTDYQQYLAWVAEGNEPKSATV